MNLIEFLLLGLFDQTAYILVSKRLLSCSKLGIKKILMFFIALASISIVNYYIDASYNFIFSAIVFFLMTWYLYKKSLFESFYATIITISIMIVVQLGILVILSLFLENVGKNFSFGMLAQSIGILFIFIFTKYVPLNTVFDFINKRNKIFIGLIMNSFVLMFVILVYWENDIEGFFENTILIGISVIVLSALNFLYLAKGLENEHERAKLEMYNRYQKITENLIEDIRLRQHEFDNHIQAIKMSKSSNIDKEYIENLEKRNDLSSLIKLESSLLGGLIYGKKNEAIKKNIDFKVSIESFCSLKDFREYELIDIVGNLLDNAFEAVKDSKKKYVSLDFKKEGSQNIIEVQNNYRYLSNSEISKMFEKGVSTKEGNGRGFGLYNIRNILKKNNSRIEVQNETHQDENYIGFKIKI